MAMEILIIVQHWDILHYAIIQGGVYGIKFVIWVRRLHLLTIDNINYFRFDSRMCYFKYMEGIIFWCGWPNWPIFGCHLVWFIMYVVCNIQGEPLCWFVTNVLKNDIWDVLYHHWKKYESKLFFSFSALNRHVKFRFAWCIKSKTI